MLLPLIELLVYNTQKKKKTKKNALECMKQKQMRILYTTRATHYTNQRYTNDSDPSVLLADLKT